MELIDFDTFLKVDMRIGQVIRAEPFPEARRPAIKLWIQFGDGIGLKQSSAQVTEYYSPENLLGKKVVAVVNLKPLKVASFKSEVLILGVQTLNGITLLATDKETSIGKRVH